MLKCQRRDSLFKSTISGTTLGSPQSRGRFSSTHNVKVTSSGYPQSLGQHNLGVKHNLGDSARMPTILGSSTISRSTLGDPQSRGQHLETHNLGVSTILVSAFGSPQSRGQRFGNRLRVSIRLPKMLGSLPPEAHNLGVSTILGSVL